MAGMAAQARHYTITIGPDRVGLCFLGPSFGLSTHLQIGLILHVMAKQLKGAVAVTTHVK